jgi:ABC-2 type transport system permease protein
MARVRDVVRFDVVRTLRKKAFWYTSFVPPLIILAIVAISYFSNQSSKNTGEEQAAAYAKTAKIAVLDDSGLLNRALLKSQKIIIEPDRAAGVAAVKNGRVDAFFYYPSDIARRGIMVYAQDKGLSYYPPYNAAASQLLHQSVITTIGRSVSNRAVLQVLLSAPNITGATYRNGQPSNALAELVAPAVFLAFFLSTVVLLSAMMISSTTEEKENRTVEILLTCARARTLVWGKITSIISLGAIQITIIAVPLLGYVVFFPKTYSLPGNISLAQLPLDPTRILLAAAFFVAGFFLFTTLIVGLGSLFPNANEAGRFLGISIIWAYVPIYVVSLVVNSPQAAIVRIFTYFPLTAPTTLLLRNAVGTIKVGEALGALAVLVGFVVLSALFAVRAFRYGALEYGQRLGFRELLSRR